MNCNHFANKGEFQVFTPIHTGGGRNFGYQGSNIGCDSRACSNVVSHELKQKLSQMSVDPL